MKQEDKTEIILSQWQTCVDTANSVSQRRDSMNNIFITLNLAILAAVSITWDVKSMFILTAGIVICFLWILFIRNYKLLNTAKFEVINKMESKLPIAPLKDEWFSGSSTKSSAKLTKSLVVKADLLPITPIE